MYTTQTYGASCSKPKKKYKCFKVSSKKRYFLRKYDKRKPYLNEEKHVRKFKPYRNYRNHLNCYVCSTNGHLAKTCPKRIIILIERPVIRQTSNQTLNSQTRPYYQERLRFGNNELIVFLSCSNVSFRTQNHISLSKEERCLVDNLWVVFDRDPKDVKYFSQLKLQVKYILC